MKKLHHIVLVLALAATLFTGCNKDEGVTPRPPVPETADQTIMFYLTGTNLGSYFRKNVDDAMNAIDRNILHNSRVLVFIQPQRGLSMVLELYYTPRNDDYVPGAQFSYEHCKVDTLRRWADADFNSMDRGTITEVISYMAEQAPARRYGLILGGHGLGWVPDGTSVNAIRFSAFQDFWSPMPDALPTRWMGDSGKRAEIPQLAAAFDNTGLHFDYLLFDACFMSSIEALYDLRGCADRIIASPCEVMAAGFNYTDILPHLLADAGTSYDLPGVCSEYHDYYMNRATTKSGCIALTVTGELEPLAAIVKEIETKYPGKTYDRASLQTYEGLDEHVFYDLQGYIEAICDEKDPLLDNFRAQMGKTFPTESRLHTPSFYSVYGLGDAPNGMHTIENGKYSGVTTSAPCERFAPEWGQTAWYRATH